MLKRQKTAGLIRYSCGILFMLFSFFYLYFLQGELLTVAQFVYSKGVTTYNLFVGALVITAVLQAVQWIVAMMSRLPSRWHALSYLPSMLLLTILTDLDRNVIQSFTFGDWIWIAPLALVSYIIAVAVVKKLSGYTGYINEDLKSQMYPNYIILLAMMLGAGSISATSDVYYYELKTERLIMEEDYEGAVKVGEKSLRATARLTQLRMYALSRQGQLAERIFEYPHLHGSCGLLDVADTMSYNRFPSQHIYAYLGAFCGSGVKSSGQYLQLLFADSLWREPAVDYYLCNLLLEKKLGEFYDVLPLYYNLSDSISDAYDKLPKAYKEALLLFGDEESALQGKVVVGTDTIATFKDSEFVARFRNYNEKKVGISNEVERINKTHREFGKTYWWYYDYSHLAEGELASQKPAS